MPWYIITVVSDYFCLSYDDASFKRVGHGVFNIFEPSRNRRICVSGAQVACGLNHTLAVSADGMMVWAFGDGDYGKLGLGNSTAKSSPQVRGCRLAPTHTPLQFSSCPSKSITTANMISVIIIYLFFSQKVDVLCGIGIKKVTCGTQFSVALAKDGSVYTFGQGTAELLLVNINQAHNRHTRE